MITLYYHPSPNPAKVSLYLEEAGIDYDIELVDMLKGEQHTPDYRRINPNAKIPAIIDHETGATVFDSTAILLYLADRTGQFGLPEAPAVRAQTLSWLMFIASGLGPFSGQAIHFRHFAPENNSYGAQRYGYEARRHWGLIEARLSDNRYVSGDEYGLADMALWGWCHSIPFMMANDDPWATFPNIKRLFDEINARPAGQRAEALRSRFCIKTEMDSDACSHMFPHTNNR